MGRMDCAVMVELADRYVVLPILPPYKSQADTQDMRKFYLDSCGGKAVDGDFKSSR